MSVRKKKQSSSGPKSDVGRKVAVSNGAKAVSSSAAAVSHQTIAERAYGLWLASGCPHGHDHEHWLQAERELRG